tara:strand:+ start:407 stop:667 length:261 start_codon:yes stop_codon:yes gene_type:complete
MKHSKYYYDLTRNTKYGESIKFKDMKYTNIKRILKNQIETGTRALWTFDEELFEFTMIFKHYDDRLKIYTPQQLLDYLDEIHLPKL